MTQPPGRASALIEIAIEAVSPRDRARLQSALLVHAETHDDRSFTHDAQSGQTMLGGLDEQGLDIFVDELRAICAIRVGAPQVAYRETIGRRVEVDYTHKSRSAGSGRFARVKIVLEPSSGVTVKSRIVGGAVPDPYVAGVEAGIGAALAAGVFAGFPVMDIAVTLIDGAWHERDSSAEAFEIAGREACREGLSSAGPALLEPVMRVEVVAAAGYEGAVVGDLRLRRGRIDSIGRSQDRGLAVEAKVPLANLFGYAPDLRGLTENTGTFTSTFHAFEAMPSPEPPKFPGAVALRIA